MHTSTDFDRSLADGVRRQIGTVGVDGGSMAVAVTGRFGLVATFGPQPAGGAGWALSGTGWGDGGYDVVEVVDAAGTITGIEVIFLAPEVSAAAETAAVALTGRPSDADWRDVYNHNAAPEAHQRVIAWDTAYSAIYNNAWEELMPAIHPADSTVACPLSELDVVAGIELGDPCYSGSSMSVAIPAGQYQAIAWNEDASEGARTARLGIYRTS